MSSYSVTRRERGLEEKKYSSEFLKQLNEKLIGWKKEKEGLGW